MRLQALKIVLCLLLSGFFSASLTKAYAAAPDLAGKTGWTAVMYGVGRDPQGDSQAGSADTDIVADATHGSLYVGYNDNGTVTTADDGLYFRLRIDNPTSSSPPVFNGVAVVGIDANLDGKIDIFVMVDGRNSSQVVRLMDPGTGANISPNTTSTTALPSGWLPNNGIYSFTTALYRGVTVSSGTDPHWNGDDDLGNDGKTDIFVSWRIPMDDLATVLAIPSPADRYGNYGPRGSTGIQGYTKDTIVQYVAFTQTQSGPINGDLNGVGASYDKNATFASLGAFTAPMSASNPVSASDAVTITKPVDANSLLNATEDNALVISGTTTPTNSWVRITITDTNAASIVVWVNATNAGPSSSVSSWSITNNLSSLADGTLTITADLVTGNSSNTLVANSSGDSTTVTLDTVAPVLAVNALATSGKPTISGTSTDVPAGSTITVSIDPNGDGVLTDLITYSVTVDASGNWSVNTSVTPPTTGTMPSSGLTSYAKITATGQDAAGNSFTATAVDYATVNPITTNDTTPTITGSWGGSNGGTDTLSITVNGVTYSSGNPNLVITGNTWSLTIPPGNALTTLASPYNVTTAVIRNSVTYSTTYTASVAVVSGPSVTITSAATQADTTPTISGTSTINNGTITLRIDPNNDGVFTDAIYYAVSTGAGGAWSLDTGNAFPYSGSYPYAGITGSMGILVSATDSSGVTATATQTLTVSIPTINITSIFTTVATNSTGITNSDFIINRREDDSITVTGTSANAVGLTVTVTVSDGDSGTTDPSGTAVVAGNGSWSVTGLDLSALRDGYLTFTASVTGASAVNTSYTHDASIPLVRISTATPLDKNVGMTIYGATDLTNGSTISVTLTPSGGSTQTVSATVTNGNWQATFSAFTGNPSSATIGATADVNATDAAGNRPATAVTQAVTVNNGATYLSPILGALQIGTIAGDNIITSGEASSVVISGTSSQGSGTVTITVTNFSGTQLFSTTATIATNSAQGTNIWSTSGLNFSSTTPNGPLIITATLTVAGSPTITYSDVVMPTLQLGTVGSGSTPTITITQVGDGNISATEHTAVTIAGSTTSVPQGSIVTIIASNSVQSISTTATVTATGTWTNSAVNLSTLNDGLFTVFASVIASSQTATNTVVANHDTTAAALAITSGPSVSDSTPVISGTSGLPAGTTITIQIDLNNDGVIDLVYQTTVQSGGSWSVDTGTATPTSGTFPVSGIPATSSVIVSGSDAAGNVSSVVSTSITSISDDRGVSSTDFITSDPTLIFFGRSGTNQTVSLVLTNSGGSTIFSTTVSANSSGIWVYDYQATTLSAGTYTLVATSTASPVSSTALQTIVIDTTPPAASTVAISGDTGTSSTDYITTDNTLVYSGTADANGSVLVTLRDENNNIIFTTSVTANGSGNWSIDKTGSTLPDGTYTLTVVTTDSAGNTTTVTKTIVIDTSAEITITTNASTSDTTPTINGTSDLEAGRTITVMIDLDNNGLYDDGPTSTYTTIVQTGGTWSLVATNTLSSGTYNVQATGTDTAGNSATATKVLTIDTNSPTLTITTPIGDGNLNATEDNAVIIQGTSTFITAGSSITVNITDGTTTISDTAVVSAMGTWSLSALNLSSLGNGVITVTASYTSNSGNTFTDTATVLHDKSGPASIDAISPDTGVLSDFITSDPTIIFYGSASSGNTVTLTLTNSAGTVLLSTNVTADASGSWSYDFRGTTLTDGNYYLKADNGTATMQTIVIDTTAPSGPVTAASQTTSDTTPTITGTAILGSGETLSVTLNGVTYTVGDGNLTIDGSGNWTLNVPAANELTAATGGGFNGVYVVTATITDTAGNTLSTTSNITISAPGVATLTPAGGGGAISADTFFTVTYTTLSGPSYLEGIGGQVTTGTLILKAPTGFQFDTGGVAPTVLVTGSATAANNINDAATGSSLPVTSVTSSQITFTVTAASTVANSLTWQDVRVKPTAGTPLTTGNIILDTSSTATMANVTAGTSNFGTLTEVPGALSAYTITVATSPVSVGTGDQLTIKLVDRFGNVLTNFTGDETLTFSGLGTSDGGNVPTVTDSTGTPINLGSPTILSFTNGVLSLGGQLTAYKAETSTLQATDGTHSTSTTGGSGASLTVNAGVFSAYRITAASSTPTAGQADALTIKQVDQYGNLVTTFSGAVNLTFSGLANSISGSIPTVTDNTGAAINLGATTAITFTSGVSTVGGSLIAYKAETATLNVTDGTNSSTNTGGTGAALTVGAGTSSGYRITAATTTPAAGAADALTIKRVDAYGNVDTTFSGGATLTFSGLSASGTGNTPTVTNDSGSPINLGTGTSLTFTNGVLSAGGVLIAYKAETATLNATDGTYATTSPGGLGVTITVSGISATRLGFSTQPARVEINSAFPQQPVVQSQDTYGNPTTTGLPGSLVVTITLTSGTGTLSGTTNIDIGTSAGNGTATYTDLQIDTAGAGKQLTASASGLTSGLSSLFEVWTIYMGTGDVIVADRGPYFSTGTILISRISDPTTAVIITSIKDPYEVSREADGNFVVVDYESSRGGGLFRIDRLTFDVTRVSSGGNFKVPFGVKVETKAPNAGQILVADLDAFSQAGAIFRVDPVTGVQTTLTQGDQFYFLQGLAVAPTNTPNFGDIYVTSVGNGSTISSKLIKVDPSTGVQTEITSGGDFNYPVGIAVEANGDILVVDAKAKKVIRVDPSTGVQTVLSDAANGAQGTPFLLPTHVALDAVGQLYISDAKVNAGANERLLFKVDKVTGNRTLITQDGFFEQPRGVQLVP